MKLVIVIVITVFIFESVSCAGGTTAGENIAKEIEKTENKLLGFINNNLQDDIQKILEKVANNKLKDADETVEDRENLKFLAIAHHTGFKITISALMDLMETLDDATRIVMFAANIKRGDLEMGTLIYPFEYNAHRFGFERNVLPA